MFLNLKPKSLSSVPWFLFLLPVFFVFHGCNENFGFIAFMDAAKLTCFYILSAIISLFILKFLIRKKGFAALFVFFCMAYFLFFGSMHDWLKNQFGANAIIAKYTFIVPAFGIFLFIISRLLSKFPTAINAISNYLNLLFFMLLIIECFLFVKISNDERGIKKLPEGMKACSDCVKPDIYFLLFDEYAGRKGLSEKFNFDNSEFELKLAEKGFHIFTHSNSNYNYTPFSMASILNMEYLKIGNSISGHNSSAVGYSLHKIKHSTVKNFFGQSGYEFVNLSIFDFEGKPAPLPDEVLPVSTRLITGQTFWKRASRDLWFNLIIRFKSKKALKNRTYFNLNNNKNIIGLLKTTVLKNSTAPRFIYSHIRMPHFPYYFNSGGIAQPYEKLSEPFFGDTSMYIEYLKYTNKEITSLVDYIKKNSAKPPIIILMSDHGFRYFNFSVDDKYVFENMNAVFFPDQNYSLLPDSVSAVNQFRVILNARFKQNLQMLKDSTIFLSE